MSWSAVIYFCMTIVTTESLMEVSCVLKVLVYCCSCSLWHNFMIFPSIKVVICPHVSFFTHI
jgi:hypothetical protein